MTSSSPFPSPSLTEPLLTCQQAAELLAVKTAWVYQAARTGRLPSIRVGRNVRLLRSDLEHFIAQQRVTDAGQIARQRSVAPSARRA
jgi:excisionase family DNA binding protein